MKLRTTLAFSLISVLLLSSCGGKGDRSTGRPRTHRTPTVEQPQETPSEQTKVSSTTQGTNSSTNKVTEHPIVNVYLENSGSMNGYVDNGKTEFQQNVYNFLCDVKISEIPSAINLNFINSQIIPRTSVIKDFINKLSPNSFKSAGGNKTTTDIAEIFGTVLKHTNDSTVSIFISDCIFSPGKIKSPEAYLANQQVGIKESVADYLKDNANLCILVYQLSSKFNGKYYDYTNAPHLYKGERPYYIWVIGHPYHVARLRQAIPDEKFSGKGLENMWCVLDHQFDVDYNVLPSMDGLYDIAPPHTIKKMKQGRGEFEFKIGANLGFLQMLLGDDYLMNTNSYVKLYDKKPTDEWYIDVTHNTVAKSPSTHNILLKTKNKVTKGEFELAIRSVVPKWVYDRTDSDDRTLDASNSHKTYGLQYMFDGVNEAFNAKSNCTYTRMIIKLQ